MEKVELLYRTWGGVIYSRCRHLLRDDALAEDATQEVFLRVMSHLSDAPEDEALFVWIHRISTNHCLNLIRNRQRHATPVANLPEYAGEHPEAEWNDHHATQALLDRAPEKLRATAALYFVEGLHQHEIADTLGISRRTVVNRLSDFLDRSMKFTLPTSSISP
jgi:RNA polymerase sigma-70 factor (ECF subfamily)